MVNVVDLLTISAAEEHPKVNNPRDIDRMSMVSLSGINFCLRTDMCFLHCDGTVLLER